jgi:hypothetical protein
MLASPELNSYLKNLQNTAIKNDINTFSIMFSQLLSAINNNQYGHNFSLSTNDMNKTMQDIAKMQPINFDTFYAYVKQLQQPVQKGRR